MVFELFLIVNELYIAEKNVKDRITTKPITNFVKPIFLFTINSDIYLSAFKLPQAKNRKFCGLKHKLCLYQLKNTNIIYQLQI